MTARVQHVEATREGGVLTLRIMRPEKRNALNGAIYDALAASLVLADGEDEIGAVVLTGAPGVFTAGNDLAEFLAHEAADELPAHRFLRALVSFGKPLVAAVEGPAVGIGATVLLHCDLAYAAPTALFRMPFVDLGLVPEAGSSLLLPRRIGMARAAELLLLARPFTAGEALAWGLVNAVVEDGPVLERALEAARALAGKPREALLASRRLLRGDTGEVLSRIEVEIAEFTRRLASPEARAAIEGVLARAKAPAA